MLDSKLYHTCVIMIRLSIQAAVREAYNWYAYLCYVYLYSLDEGDLHCAS